MSIDDRCVSFPSDDAPPDEADRLQILALDDYFLSVLPPGHKVAPACFRARVSGERDWGVTALIAALYKYGRGDLEGAVGVVETFVDHVAERKKYEGCRGCDDCRGKPHHWLAEHARHRDPVWDCDHCDFRIPRKTEDAAADFADYAGPRVDRSKGAAEIALDAIAEAVGAPDWEYPNQVVRDVQAKFAQLRSRQTRDGDKT